MELKIDDIKVSQRLRQIDDTKVYDLMESIQLVGLLHPILVDSECNLLAGNHRLEAMRLIGCETIECKQVNLSAFQHPSTSPTYSEFKLYNQVSNYGGC